jgi:hypothetical protein
LFELMPSVILKIQDCIVENRAPNNMATQRNEFDPSLRPHFVFLPSAIGVFVVCNQMARNMHAARAKWTSLTPSMISTARGAVGVVT